MADTAENRLVDFKFANNQMNQLHTCIALADGANHLIFENGGEESDQLGYATRLLHELICKLKKVINNLDSASVQVCKPQGATVARHEGA